VNIAMLLEMAADAMPERPAVGRRSMGQTYGELHRRAQVVAGQVSKAGIERLDLVGINGDDLPALLFGSAMAGVSFSPCNYRLNDDQLRAIIARTAPALVVADPSAADRLQDIDGTTIGIRSQFGAGAVAGTGDGQAGPDQVAIWLFTSGTTGEPKAALLRHRHLTSYVLSTVDFMAADEDEAALVCVPPYHIAGMATILSSTYSGRRIVYLPQFDPDDWVGLASDEGITHAMVVPTMLGRILDSLERNGGQLPALRHLSYGGGRMPLPVVERAMRMLPHVGFVNAYGLTETSSTVAVLDPDDHRGALESDDAEVRARLSSVGRPLPTLDLEIRDDDGRVVDSGQTGQIYVRGDQIAGEYHGKSALDENGWFATNDAGHLDSYGFLYVEGRLDDVIVRGGENISPGEIEDVILQCPGVEATAVVGLPDDEWGEQVAAAVVLHPGSDVGASEISEFVRARLRSTRTPTVIQIREQLPYNETGKLLRRVLRREIADFGEALAGGAQDQAGS
jgi:acyl-CoA synthetase (AMP-forming)/AMP-acid ligase II